MFSTRRNRDLVASWLLGEGFWLVGTLGKDPLSDSLTPRELRREGFILSRPDRYVVALPTGCQAPTLRRLRELMFVKMRENQLGWQLTSSTVHSHYPLDAPTEVIPSMNWVHLGSVPPPERILLGPSDESFSIPGRVSKVWP